MSGFDMNKWAKNSAEKKKVFEVGNSTLTITKIGNYIDVDIAVDENGFYL